MIHLKNTKVLLYSVYSPVIGLSAKFSPDHPDSETKTFPMVLEYRSRRQNTNGRLTCDCIQQAGVISFELAALLRYRLFSG